MWLAPLAAESTGLTKHRANVAALAPVFKSAADHFAIVFSISVCSGFFAVSPLSRNCRGEQ
jgi:hypothetical protein